jgi:hypothetical protein
MGSLAYIEHGGSDYIFMEGLSSPLDYIITQVVNICERFSSTGIDCTSQAKW